MKVFHWSHSSLWSITTVSLHQLLYVLAPQLYYKTHCVDSFHYSILYQQRLSFSVLDMFRTHMLMKTAQV